MLLSWYTAIVHPGLANRANPDHNYSDARKSCNDLLCCQQSLAATVPNGSLTKFELSYVGSFL